MMLQEYVAPSLGTSGVCGSGEDGRGGAGGAIPDRCSRD